MEQDVPKNLAERFIESVRLRAEAVKEMRDAVADVKVSFEEVLRTLAKHCEQLKDVLPLRFHLWDYSYLVLEPSGEWKLVMLEPPVRNSAAEWSRIKSAIVVMEHSGALKWDEFRDILQRDRSIAVIEKTLAALGGKVEENLANVRACRELTLSCRNYITTLTPSSVDVPNVREI